MISDTSTKQSFRLLSIQWNVILTRCTECHVRKGPELAQVGFDPAALFDAFEINREISIDKYGIKRSRKKLF